MNALILLMYDLQKPIIIVLVSISIVGAIGIPMGDPQFLANAIGLELAFVSLASLSAIRIKFALIPNIVIACTVIIGNTLSAQHMDIMTSLNPIDNAIVLIVGGYILQALLLITSALQIKNRRNVVNLAKNGE